MHVAAGGLVVGRASQVSVGELGRAASIRVLVVAPAR